MKLSSTYLLIILFSLQSFGVNAMNLVDFSNLISHYNHHKTEHQDTFWEFIDLHYGSQKQAHSDEHDEHQELPFHEGYSLATSIFYTSPEQFHLVPIQLITSTQENFKYEDHFSFLHASEILQPPKNLINYKS